MNTHFNKVVALVPFRAGPVPTARIVASNLDEEMPDDFWLDNFAFLTECASEAESKTFFAEQYGGTGLRTHGGGARAGIWRKYQVKGIGPTPLVGESSDVLHSHGALPLASAIEEAIWGEVFDRALPYGAVRASAVIATGKTCVALGAPGVFVSVPAGLLVRKSVLRPAHFMRTLWFQPRTRPDGQYTHDADRVRNAIQHLALALPMSDAPARRVVPRSASHLAMGLAELARRFAEQLAAAKSRRLMHGAVSGSNICIDGRWMDFGSASALPRYANVCRVQPAFWDDHHIYPTIFEDLLFYVRKYLVALDLGALPSAAEFISLFYEHYARALGMALLRSAGFPGQILEDLGPRPEFVRLAGEIRNLATAGTPRVLPEDSAELAQVGAYDVGAILVALCRANRATAAAESLETLEPLIRVKAIRDGVVAAHAAAAELARARGRQLGIRDEAFDRLVLLNATRFALGMPELHAHVLRPRIAALLADEIPADAQRGAVEALIGRIRRRAELMFADSGGATCPAWRSEQAKVDYDAHADRWNVRISGGARTVVDSAAIAAHPHPEVRAMRECLQLRREDLA